MVSVVHGLCCPCLVPISPFHNSQIPWGGPRELRSVFSHLDRFNTGLPQGMCFPWGIAIPAPVLWVSGKTLGFNNSPENCS